MSKSIITTFIQHLKKADLTTKITPWMVEGAGDKAWDVRYVGLKLSSEWLEIFSPQDNVLLKFKSSRTETWLEFYLANKTPFFKVTSWKLNENSKWEVMFGELRRQLKKDKQEFQHHQATVNNLFKKLQPFLK